MADESAGISACALARKSAVGPSASADSWETRSLKGPEGKIEALGLDKTESTAIPRADPITALLVNIISILSRF